MSDANATTYRQRPNVLLLMADALRRDALGCYGKPRRSDPEHRPTGARGRSLRSRLRHQPFLLAGPRQHTQRAVAARPRPLDNGVRWPRDTTTLATVLDAVGYRTAIAGKGHLNVHYNVPDSPDHVFGWDDPARAELMAGREYYGFREQWRTCAHSKPAG